MGWVGELPLGDWPAMGVRADGEDWPQPAAPDLLDLRRRILAAHPDTVLALPGTDGACAEAAALAGAAGAPGDGRDALAAAATVQPDDLCLLAPQAGWPLVAGAVLFGSHWRLADKIGRPLTEVHEPVPGYGDLASKVERFLDRLRPGAVAWRRNVLLHRDGELHAPVPSTAAVVPEGWWLRSERQTFRRLPRSGHVLFTIAVSTAPLEALGTADRHRLAAWLHRLPPSWSAYNGVPVAALADHLSHG